MFFLTYYPLHQVSPISAAPLVPTVTTRMGGEKEVVKSACFPGCWDREALVPVFFCPEPHLSHPPEQAQTCHTISTPEEDTVGSIPAVGAWGWGLVTEC